MNEWRYENGVLVNPEAGNQKAAENKPWENEPNRVSWTDDKTGLRCTVFRNQTWGYLCGCVDLEIGHPLYGIRSADINEGALSFERRLTCYAYTKRIKIKPENCWRIMFDCFGNGDLAPWTNTRSFRPLVYRNMDYAKEKTAELASKVHQLSQ